MPKGLILIPARYQSSRFPGKPLAKIAGQTMISRVAANCGQSGQRTLVVTDNQDIFDHVKAQGYEAMRVDVPVETGGQRIYLAYEKLGRPEVDFIINVQGDEPLLTSEDIERLVDAHHKSHYEVMTLVKKRSSLQRDDLENPNIVKAVYSPESKECHYFSRSPVPFNREGGEFDWYQHIGVYLYSVKALDFFFRTPPSMLEKRESLEQLRFIEHGTALGAVETQGRLVGVDTPDDIQKVEEVLRESNQK